MFRETAQIGALQLHLSGGEPASRRDLETLVAAAREAALPCHAAQTIPHLTFDTVRNRSLGDIWRDDPAFNAYRGTDWMPVPCASCDRKTGDFGGCRCEAIALALAGMQGRRTRCA